MSIRVGEGGGGGRGVPVSFKAIFARDVNKQNTAPTGVVKIQEYEILKQTLYWVNS